MEENPTVSKKKILIVDDEPVIITYLSTVLEDNGYETCSATDADSGMASAKEYAPDLICLDIMMPRRSGIALYRDLKLEPQTKNIPVIIVSAFNQVRDMRNPNMFRKMVPDESIPQPEAYIEKPIIVLDFLKTIEAHLCKAPSE